MQPFNSRDEFYKLPFGAVKEDHTIIFKIALEYRPIDAYLCINKENSPVAKIPMSFEGEIKGRYIYTASFTPIAYGLYFYYFEMPNEHIGVYNTGKGTGSVLNEGVAFQLTVYKKDFTTPQNTKGKIFYQIFPDRFNESTPREQLHFPDRVYRKNKTAEPYFYPTEKKDGYLNLDYYGGDLQGIIQKLDYLKGLNISYIYLNPIFEAHANHRYNTADYMKIDPDLGTVEDFRELCTAAKDKGISIILDGVFSHTGSDSIYFNKEGRYGNSGAYRDINSPYRSWFDFDNRFASGYRAWWDFDTLPEVNELNDNYVNYICGNGGVIDYWLSQGAGGFRLDVADELPDSFIRNLRLAVKRHGEDKLLIGEVWEDATNKVSFNSRREYLLGDGLDTTMNYPFRTAILSFLRNGDGFNFCEQIISICENYPKEALDIALNNLSTHDTPRAMTWLCAESPDSSDRYWQSGRKLSKESYATAAKLLSCGFALLFGLPGVPCIYYGDEIGMEGYRDPFNRGYFQWWNIDAFILNKVKALAHFRLSTNLFSEGKIHFVYASQNSVAFIRYDKSQASQALVAVNRGDFSEQFSYKDKIYTVQPLSFLTEVLE